MRQRTSSLPPTWRRLCVRYVQQQRHPERRWLRAYASTTTAGAASDTLSVWSFNLRTALCEEQDGADGWCYRADGCAALIKRYSPAALCVQEATKPMLDSLCGRLGYQWFGECRDGTGEDEHSALLWDPVRLRLLQGETRWLSPTPEEVSVGWDAQYPRIYTRGLFQLRGCDTNVGADAVGTEIQFALMSTHFDHVGHVARLESASLVRSMVQVESGWRVPTILCGDFNSVKSAEEGSAYHILTTAGSTGTGFEDAWVTCPAAGRSWNGLGEDGSTIHKFKGWVPCPVRSSVLTNKCCSPFRVGSV